MGTSFDSYLNATGLGRHVRGLHMHVDDSYFRAAWTAVRRVTWIREPASRSLSNIMFWMQKKSLRITAPAVYEGKWNMSKILSSPGACAAFHPAIADGWGGTAWVAGLVNGFYVRYHPRGRAELKRRQKLLDEKVEVLIQGLRNLEHTLWFGLVEEKKKSLQMFKWQFNVRKTILFPESNKGAKLWDLVPTEEDYRILRRRVHPMDTIFHEYAVALFDLRYEAFKAGARRSDCMPRLSNSDDQLRQFASRRLAYVWDRQPWPPKKGA